MSQDKGIGSDVSSEIILSLRPIPRPIPEDEVRAWKYNFYYNFVTFMITSELKFTNFHTN